MTTDYIIPKFDIEGSYFINTMCSGYTYKILATECAGQDFSCRKYFNGNR